MLPFGIEQKEVIETTGMREAVRFLIEVQGVSMTMVFAKMLINVCGIFAAVWLLRTRHEVDGLKISFYYLIRLSIMVAVGGVINYYPGDVPWFRDAINAGRHAGTFNEGYGGFFCLLLSGALSIFDSPMSILIVFNICEWIGALLVFHAFKKYHGDGIASCSLILYMFNPIVLQGAWLGGQDEGMQFLAVGILLTLLDKSSRWMVPLAASVMLHATKPQSLWVVAPFLIGRRMADWTLCGVFSVGILACFHFTNIHHYSFLNFQSPIVCSGTIWFVLEKTLGYPVNIPLALALVFAAFLWITVWCMGLPVDSMHNRVRQVGFAAVLFALIFALCGPFVFPQYCTYALPFVGYLFYQQKCSKWMVGLYILWSCLYSLDATLNYRVFNAFKSGSSLSTSGCVWALMIIVLHVTMIGIVIRSLRQSGGSLRRGMTLLLSKLKNEC